jgi:predicted  nucleic acid-binding Zn-ribbon protein|tara:strand:- start:821 stop:1177 length:357 start_codon:yes stop_codon:yes gene_type:complete
MTQKQLLESVLSELVHIKKHMPNGELKQMQKDVEALKQDMSDLKYTLLNPEDGVIVKTNQNTFFRRRLEENEKDFSSKMLEVKDLKKWKDGVNKALWIIFATLFGVVIKLISEVIKLS